MNFTSIWNHTCLPFTIGVRESPRNGGGFPDCMPFELVLDSTTGVLMQRSDPSVTAALGAAYAAGSLLGTAMDDTPLGRRYAEDFVGYLETLHPLNGLRVLEIGAGRGYLLCRLKNAGAIPLGVEPGDANRHHWSRHGVHVISKPFPCPEAAGPFDLIVAYALLEHIEDLTPFLQAVKAALAPGGLFVVSVPNCEPYIAAGDPSMLLHEHFSYFTRKSLERTLAIHGWTTIDTRLASYGGAIYAASRLGGGAEVPSVSKEDVGEALAYGNKCRELVASIGQRVEALAETGKSLGIYCPARGLAVLPVSGQYRFFDDDPELTGRYYPPFAAPVEPRSALLTHSVDELWILSRTFGRSLAAVLQPELPATVIRLPDDIAGEHACGSPEWAP